MGEGKSLIGRRWGSLLVLVATLVSLLPLGRPASAAPADLVISQIYGGGGNTGAPYQNDYIEIFNRGAAAVALGGLSLQYTSATGTGNLGANAFQLTELPTMTLAPGQYLLVQEAPGAGVAAPLPAPDVIDPTPINMSATGGKVALVSGTDARGCNGGSTLGPAAALARIIDLIGYDGANFFEGSGPSPTLSNTTAAFRLGAGCVDTDNNSSDFVTGAPAPRNTASAPGNCTDQPPAVASTAPANGASGVALDANVLITFAEPVNVSGGWFAIACAASGIHTATAAGGPTSFTLNPDADFAMAESCAVTVLAANVTDQDLIDPPDAMAADFVFSFTTVAPTRRIHEIQGAAHRSPLSGQLVGDVSGIVTAKRTNGFYMQDPSPDADPATSEAIFVFTSSPPSVSVGDAVLVNGRVSEFRPGGASTGNLTTTELVSPTFRVVSSGNSLPPPTVIGLGGRLPPTAIIENDTAPAPPPGDVETSGVFDPSEDGIDFYESLEGMLVQVNDPFVVGPTNSFNEIPVLADGGTGTGPRSARGGIRYAGYDDGNPERIILDDEILKLAGGTIPTVNVGDRFAGSVVGVLDYNFGNFMVELTAVPTAVSGGLAKETTSPPGANELAVATFNVQNLDANDPQSKFDTLAGLVVTNLRSPDLIAVEEVQDNDGPANTATVDASATIGKLVAGIQAAGGPAYTWRQIDPVDDQDGGEPGGNIRQIFLFRTDRGLAFIDRPGGTSTTATSVGNVGGEPELTFSPGRVDPANGAWTSSRKPLAGEFTFNTRHLFVVANHFNSKGGDPPLMGHFQPPTRSSEVQRARQAQLVSDFVKDILAIDARADVVVLGDLNDFQFSHTLAPLKARPLNDLTGTRPDGDRYTYVFEGNSQTLDHILVSIALRSSTQFDVVHVNAEFADQASDHDPSVARIRLLDIVPPTISGAATTSPNANGWYNGPVTVHFTCQDNSGAVDCPGDVTLRTEGAGQSVTGTARDAAGNTASATVGPLNIDLTAPTITFSGGLTYTVDQAVSIICTATDALSGIATATCPGASGPAYGFGLGAHRLDATAMDKAGNTRSASTTFTVGVTRATLCAVVRRLVTKEKVAKSLCRTLGIDVDDDDRERPDGDRDRDGPKQAERDASDDDRDGPKDNAKQGERADRDDA